jgi:hypothetical protein
VICILRHFFLSAVVCILCSFFSSAVVCILCWFVSSAVICMLCYFLLSPVVCILTQFLSSEVVCILITFYPRVRTVCQFSSSEVVCILTQFLSCGPYCVPVHIICSSLYSVIVPIFTSYFTEFHIVLPNHLCLKTGIYVLIVQWFQWYVEGCYQLCFVVSQYMTSVQVYMQFTWQ